MFWNIIKCEKNKWQGKIQNRSWLVFCDVFFSLQRGFSHGTLFVGSVYFISSVRWALFLFLLFFWVNSLSFCSVLWAFIETWPGQLRIQGGWPDWPSALELIFSPRSRVHFSYKWLILQFLIPLWPKLPWSFDQTVLLSWEEEVPKNNLEAFFQIF